MIDQVSIVLIHGAGLGNDVWSDLRPKLQASALMVNFPNRNKGKRANASLSINDYLAKAIAEIDQTAQEQLIIVTHSVGGLIGLKVAEHFQERVIGFVGIGAAIPRSGQSFASCLPFPQNIILPVLLKLTGTKPPDAAIRRNLCHDLTESQTRQIIDNFTPESARLFTEAIHYQVPSADKLYIALSEDREFPLSVQNTMADNLQSDEAVQLHSGHLPMLSQPDELATVLNEFAEQCVHSLKF